MSGKRITKAMKRERVRGLVAGTVKHAPSGTVTLANTTYATTDLVRVIQSLGDALDAVHAAKAGWQDALNRARDVGAKVIPVMRDYETWVAITYRGAPSMLADYGVVPAKVPAPLTAEEKATAAQRRRATRAARHTMGKNQKKDVGGVVTATPVVQPAEALTTGSAGPPARARPM
jgi:hypothetical protein